MSGPPPPTSNETAAAIHNAEQSDNLGQSQGGKDAGAAVRSIDGTEGEKPKTAKESMDDPKPEPEPEKRVFS